MRLSRVQIINFRSIKDLTISFDPRCRVLVGINEAGKSNILRALSLLSPDRQSSAEDVRVAAPDEPIVDRSFVRFVFRLSKEERIGLLEGIEDRVCSATSRPLVNTPAGSLSLAKVVDGVAECLYQVDVPGEKGHGSYWSFPKDRELLAGWMRPTKSCPDSVIMGFDDEAEPLKSFALVHRDNLTDSETSYVEPASIGDLDRLIGGALASHAAKNLPKCVFWEHSEKYLLPATVALAEFAESPQEHLPLMHAFALAGVDDISDEIAKAIGRSNGIRNLLDRVAKSATAHIRDVWPEYRGIEIDLRQNGALIEASVKDVHNLYGFGTRSDGFKRFIAFLLMISAPVKTESLRDVLILNDDPDAGLHPAGARYLRDELIRISRENYVVYSTHSIFMIDRENVGRHLIVTKHGEVTGIAEADESNILDEEVLYNALGFSLLEVLKPWNVVFEGWRDKRLMQVALARVPATAAQAKQLRDVGSCHAQGARDIKRLLPVLELANRGCTIVSDSDRVAKECQEDHFRNNGYGIWLRYDEILPTFGATTGEDFLKVEAINRAVATVAKQRALAGPAFGASGDRGVLSEVERWLVAAGLPRESLKEVLNEIKREAFSDLKVSHIRSDYYECLTSLAALITSQKTKAREAPLD